MTKKEFLDTLKRKLEVLNEEEVNDILKEYEEHIDESIKDGVKEEYAIKEFGNIGDLVKDILSAYKINVDNYNSSNDFVKKILSDTKSVFDKFINILTHGSFKKVCQMIIYILCALLVVAIIRVPFMLLLSIIEKFIDIFPEHIYGILDTFISIFMNVAFIVLGYIVFIKLLNEKLDDEYEISNKKVIKEKKVTKKDNKIIEEKIVYKNERTFLDSIADLFKFCFRIIACFILLFVAFGLVCSAIGVAYTIMFSINYKFFLGPILASIGVLTGCIWLCNLLFCYICKKSVSFKNSFITFIIAIIMCGSGIGITLIEINKIDFKNYDQELTLSNTYTYHNIHNIETINTVELIKDESIKDGEIIVKIYIPSFIEVDIDEENNHTLHLYLSQDGYLFYKQMLNDIKSGTFYNYEYSNTSKIEVYGNKKTLKDLNVSYY